MKTHNLLSRFVLLCLVISVATVFHFQFRSELPENITAYQSWLADFEDDLLHGESRAVAVSIKVRSSDMNRAWELNLDGDTATDREKRFIMRILHLIQEGGLLEESEDSNEYLSVSVRAPDFEGQALVAWDTLFTNIAAMNLLVLLENVQATPVLPFANENVQADETKG